MKLTRRRWLRCYKLKTNNFNTLNSYVQTHVQMNCGNYVIKFMPTEASGNFLFYIYLYLSHLSHSAVWDSKSADTHFYVLSSMMFCTKFILLHIWYCSVIFLVSFSFVFYFIFLHLIAIHTHLLSLKLCI